MMNIVDPAVLNVPPSSLPAPGLSTNPPRSPENAPSIRSSALLLRRYPELRWSSSSALRQPQLVQRSRRTSLLPSSSSAAARPSARVRELPETSSGELRRPSSADADAAAATTASAASGRAGPSCRALFSGARDEGDGKLMSGWAVVDRAGPLDDAGAD